MSSDPPGNAVTRFLHRRYWPLLLLVLLLSSGLRIGTYHGLKASDPGFLSLGLDSRYFIQWGERIAAGDLLGKNELPLRPFFMNPLYPYFLAPIVAATGAEGALLAIRVVQVVLGLLTVLLVADLTRRFSGRTAGLIAAVLAGTYPLLLFYEQKVMIVTLAIFLNALLLWCLSRMLERPSLKAALLAGIPLGLSVLARPNVILFVLLLPFWFRGLAPAGRRVRFVAARMTLLLAGVVLMVLPVTLRNTFVGGDFVPVTSSMGVNLWQSNNPYGWSTGWMASNELRANPTLMEDDAYGIAENGIALRETAVLETGRDFSEGEAEEYWSDYAKRMTVRTELAMHDIAREKSGVPWEQTARRRIAMREVAKRKIAERDVASGLSGRSLGPEEVRAYWSEREISKEEIAGHWSGSRILAGDIPAVWLEATGSPKEMEPGAVAGFWGERSPAEAEVREVMEPFAREYWEARASELHYKDPGRLIRESADRHWQDRMPPPEIVEEVWGKRTLSSAQKWLWTRPIVKRYWDGIQRDITAREMSSYWTRRTLEKAAKNPGAALFYLVRKFFYFFRGFEMPSSHYFEIESDETPILDAIPLSYGLISPFLLFGGILVLRRRKRALPLPFFVFAYLVGLVIFYPLGHYRAPMLPAGIALAAMAAAHLGSVVARRRRREMVAALLVLLACFGIAFTADLARVAGATGFAGLEDNRVMFFYNRGQYLMGERRFGEARVMFRRAQEGNPQSEWGYLGMAAAAGAIGDLATEEIFIQRAIEVTSGSPPPQKELDAHYAKWFPLARRGDSAQAEDLIWEAIRRWPNAVQPRIWLLQYEHGRVNPSQWRRNLRAAIALRPEGAVLWVNLGRNWFDQGNREAGIALAEEAAKIRTTDEQINTNLALLYLQSERYEESLEQFRRAELSRKHPDAVDIADMSWCLRKLGRFEEAQAELDRGMKLFPDSQPLHVEQALVLIDAGQADDEAIRAAIRKALDLGAEVREEFAPYLPPR